MNTRTKAIGAVPLRNAVFCAGCESITNSPHDRCTVCGSPSLTSLSRLLGEEPERTKGQARTAKYNLALVVKVQGVPGAELNEVMHLLSRLADAGGGLADVHVQVESIVEAEHLISAA
jgi:hypothetical protein